MFCLNFWRIGSWIVSIDREIQCKSLGFPIYKHKGTCLATPDTVTAQENILVFLEFLGDQGSHAALSIPSSAQSELK
jgi:hypothetical protein